MRLSFTICFLVSITPVALGNDVDLPPEVLTSESAVTKMVKMTTLTKAAYPEDYRVTVSCAVSHAVEMVQSQAPFPTADQKKLLPGETATERSARLQKLVDELQQQKVQRPLVTRTRHSLSPVAPAVNANFRLILSEQVVADLKRLGIDNLKEHFAGKVVTARGIVTWEKYTIDIAPRNFEVHVDTLADIIDVKTAANNPTYLGTSVGF